MSNITIKFQRSIPGDIPSYGTEFNQKLDDLVGGAEQWDTTHSHGIASIPNTKSRVERYEVGPEIFDVVWPVASPLIAAALTYLFEKWLESRKRKNNEMRSVKVTQGDKTIEYTVYSVEEAQRFVEALGGEKTK